MHLTSTVCSLQPEVEDCTRRVGGRSYFLSIDDIETSSSDRPNKDSIVWRDAEDIALFANTRSLESGREKKTR